MVGVMPFEAEIRVNGEFGQAGFLQLEIIVGIEVVERDHGAAVGKQTPRDVKADETASASDENRLHRALLSPLTSDQRRQLHPQQFQSSAMAPTI